MKNILVLGNKPLKNLPNGSKQFSKIYAFGNNLKLIDNHNSETEIIGVVQDFTLNFHESNDEFSLKEIRRQKALKIINSENVHSILLIGTNLSFYDYYNLKKLQVIRTFDHRDVLKIMFKSLPPAKIIKKLGLKGIINSLLCFFKLKKKINSRYRISSGVSVVLYLYDIYKEKLEISGFSNLDEDYIVSEKVHITKLNRPHSIMDELFHKEYNFLLKNENTGH